MTLCFFKPLKLTSLLSAGLLLTLALYADSLSIRSDLPAGPQVVAFLTQSIDWYRQSSREQQIATEPAELVFLYDNQPIAAQIVQLSFDFARADAALSAPSSAAPNAQATSPIADRSAPNITRFLQLQRKVEEEADQSRQRLKILNQQLVKARKAERKRLQAALDEAGSRLELLQAGAASLNELLGFLRTSGADNSRSGNLESVIDDLARTVPVPGSPATVQQSTQNSNSPSVSQPQRFGIPGVASEVSALQRKLRIVDDGMRLTDDLARTSQNLRVPLLGLVKKVVQSGDASDLQANDLHTLQRQKAQLDSLTLRLKALSPALMALDKQKVLLSTYKSNLGGWRAAVVTQYESAWKDLTLQALIPALMIASLLVLAAVLRRVTDKHVRDANRRRLILVSQRVVIWSTALLVAVFAFAANLSSIVTFFGLLTAGVAVALQSVIVASLGYLVLVGKRGIRVGDRVQVSGTTGEVIDMGLLQFQLREFDTASQQLTDNVVTFSNSFIFVSPATGLFRLKPDTRNARQPEDIHDSAITAITALRT
jgi:hypothetical protein